MRSVEILPHTADIGIRVTADGLAELFSGAAEAMFGLMYACPPGAETVERQVTADGADTVELLWDWLSTLLAWAEIDEASYRSIGVELGDGTARGTARGLPVGECDVVGPPVKAVTLHRLSVVGEDGRWRATIIFDV